MSNENINKELITTLFTTMSEALSFFNCDYMSEKMQGLVEEFNSMSASQYEEYHKVITSKNRSDLDTILSDLEDNCADLKSEQYLS